MFLMYLICGSVDIWYFLTIRATQTTDYMFLMYLICGLVDIKSLIMHKQWYSEPENIYKYTVSNIRSEDSTTLGHPPAHYLSHQSAQLILEMSPYRYYAVCAIIVAVFGGWRHVWGWAVAYLAASLVFCSYAAV